MISCNYYSEGENNYVKRRNTNYNIPGTFFGFALESRLCNYCIMHVEDFHYLYQSCEEEMKKILSQIIHTTYKKVY